MERKRTTIYLKKQNKDFVDKYKINLSEFVNEAITNKFLSIDIKTQRLQDIELEKQKILKEIEEIQENIDFISKSLTTHEQRFVAQVLPRLREGKSEEALWKRFNIEFSRNFSFEEFRELYRLYERQAQNRAEFALKKKYEDIKKNGNKQ